MRTAVIGLQFGDEGKGIVTDLLASQLPNALNVRYSGGQQAGHTVVKDDFRHVFSNFGAGSLRGLPTYWSEYCTVCPTGILNELTDLIDKGVRPQLLLNRNAPVTTPYDMKHNRTMLDHGTCGVGVGATWEREERFYSLKVEDLCHEFALRAKLENIGNAYSMSAEMNGFVQDCIELVNSSYVKLVNSLPFAESYIFEGSQGLLLDQHYGFFPNVTRSNTGSKNIMEILPDGGMHWHLVTRAYQTRHGNGFMTNEGMPHDIEEDPNETNVYNKYQGEFRRSMLDVSLLKYAIAKDHRIQGFGRRTLVVTCLDHLRKFTYTMDGDLHECKDAQTFAREVADHLNIEDVLISKSPDSSNIKELA